MVSRLVRAFDPVSVILFGSHARGVAGPDSDVDLLVVVDHVRDRRELTVDMRHELADLPLPKDIVVATSAELSLSQDTVDSSVVAAAVREGKVLYSRGR
ncbi:MAG: nucleotidyltransferase domain-containing protein [Armatimonadia bacterium]|nr:nucleotidyltransferase domain-containing protein [Armatimonadia bacterium]